MNDQNDLAVLAQRGDQAAKSLLVTQNERFVISVARQYLGQGMELDDLIQEGNIGLLKAIERFDIEIGTKFLTYASWWIKQSILQALGEYNREIRIPANRIVIIEKYKKEHSRLTQDLMREPSDAEVLGTMNADSRDVVNQTSISYNAPFRGEHEGSLLDILPGDFPAPDANLMDQAYKKELSMILRRLNKRECTIIKMSYGIDLERSYTLEEIGDKLKLTRERIRQIKTKALKTLRRLNRHRKMDGIKD